MRKLVDTRSASHPESADLTAFAQGKTLSDADSRRIEAHLSECPACQEVVQNVEPDPFMLALQQTSVEPTLREHRLVEGYELLEQLGSGGAGVVYRARQPALDREVAIKVLRSGVAASKTELERWHRETRTLAALDHPHIVKIFDAGEQTGTPFIAMELVVGDTLAEVLRRKPLEANAAAALVRDLADAMHYAHERSIIHRDLKPGNVLVPDEGTLTAAKVADFGLSRWLQEESHTRTGDALGTPSYMAPEQVRGATHVIGPATDVYGLGSILYECLTGRPPFHGASAVETMQMVLDRDAQHISRYRSEVPTDLEAICLRCLEKEPGRRYASAADLREDLGRFLESKPVIARKPSRLRIARMWITRNPWLASFAALAVAATVVGAVAMLWHQRTLNRQRATAHRHYAQARETIWDMLASAKSYSALDIPKVGEMALLQAEEALDLFERLAAEEHSEEAELELARIKLDLGTLYLTQGRNEEGRKQLQQALDTITRYANADSLDRLSEALAAQVKLAVALTAQQRYDEAALFLAHAKEITKRVIDIETREVGWLNNIAWVHHTDGTLQWKQRKLDEAQVSFEEAVLFREQAALLDPENTELAQYLIESRLSLAQCRVQLGELEEARDSTQRAISDIDEIVSRTGPDLSLVLARATALLNLSNILAALETAAEAVNVCSQGIVSLRPFFEAEPNNATVKERLFQLYGNRALYRMSASEAGAAIPDWQTAIKIAPTVELRDYCRTLLVRCLTMTDQVAAAIAEVESLEAEAISTDNLFRVAAAWGGLANHVRPGDQRLGLEFAARSARVLGALNGIEPISESEPRFELWATSDDFLPARSLIVALTLVR